jgi:hypothetical protein
LNTTDISTFAQARRSGNQLGLLEDYRKGQKLMYIVSRPLGELNHRNEDAGLC